MISVKKMFSFLYYNSINKVLTFIHRGIVIGCDVKFRGRIRIYINNSLLKIEDNVTIEDNISISAVEESNIKIGRDVYINRNAIIMCREKIEIRRGTIIGPNVSIYDHNHQFSYDSVENKFKTKPITIGENCWIGAGCILLKGCNIGDNCIIGAGTIVAEDIPAHSIVTSNRDLTIERIEKG